jgi:hypothetical protein
MRNQSQRLSGEAVDRVTSLIEDEVKARFPGSPIERVVLLQYGDEPTVEPGEIIIRVLLASGTEEDERKQVLDDFHRAFGRELEKFRDELARKLPEVGRIEFLAGDGNRGPHIVLGLPGRAALEGRALSGGESTPVMARLGPTDLETLDTLITAGIAGSRADAVRWALARIRERPAYEQLRAKSQEIEELKAQF